MGERAGNPAAADDAGADGSEGFELGNDGHAKCTVCTVRWCVCVCVGGGGGGGGRGGSEGPVVLVVWCGWGGGGGGGGEKRAPADGATMASCISRARRDPPSGGVPAHARRAPATPA